MLSEHLGLWKFHQKNLILSRDNSGMTSLFDAADLVSILAPTSIAIIVFGASLYTKVHVMRRISLADAITGLSLVSY